jgi:hypothetical protein
MGLLGTLEKNIERRLIVPGRFDGIRMRAAPLGPAKRDVAGVISGEAQHAIESPRDVKNPDPDDRQDCDCTNGLEHGVASFL